ncbi:radical SAM protein [Cnuibacter physcomitrellae]|uniref:Radical SAM protein n=1 Tax=Cnuibacter physcomitrellae TaxID=1619308 RepID=A0A1X9LQ65_9MICO|nr:Rv2578c family radical SAM protein [Cnuibacter physcomitrellae]ARJ06081.1 radical SAM protein [Cnuibacter physcomitrellae]GGI37174.1 radical SAM protein [Cnuibacter physcomitrellae]
MRWDAQQLTTDTPSALPGLAKLNQLVRSVTTPEFAGVTFHEVLAKSALNHVPGTSSAMPNAWTINPYRGCSHACVYCFARPTHDYLELGAGDGFDREIVVKVNVAEVLAAELRRPRWAKATTEAGGVPAVALGTNTDPYQRAEGRYSLMPGILRELTTAGAPFSILTKGSLLRRDLDLIADAAEEVPVSLAMSIAVYDDELQASVEPGTPSTKARLATVRAVREKGLPCQVFLMPILPLLTDTVEHLDRALGMVAESGATSVVWTPLHLKPGVKQWYLAWLGREHPELMPAYARLYSRGAYAPAEYRRWLEERMRPLLRKHRLTRGAEASGTGGPVVTRGSSDLRVPVTGRRGGAGPAFPPASAVDQQLALF